VYDV